MKHFSRKSFLLLILCLLLQTVEGKELHSPDIIYLTWVADPTTSMVVQWHTPKDSLQPTLFYRKTGAEEWQTLKATSSPFTGSPSLVQTAHLTHLTPNTRYQFSFSEQKEKCYLFHTLPTALEERPLCFADAGDAYCYIEPFKKLARQIARKNPDFMIVGGDIAYTHHGVKSFFSPENGQIKRWQTFLRSWTQEMRREDGSLIPLLPILGNHDIHGKEENPHPPHFFQLFAMPSQLLAYRSLLFGNYLHLLMLDTGHYSPISGGQTSWLDKALQEHKNLPYLFAAYHVAAYPSVYKPSKQTPTLIRSHWCPLFEEAGLQVAFEHHNHAFKRTHKIKAGKIDPQGVLYLGDGCWGVKPRPPKKTSYLAKTEKTHHFWLATLTPERCHLQAFDLQGKLIDQVYQHNHLSTNELSVIAPEELSMHAPSCAK